MRESTALRGDVLPLFLTGDVMVKLNKTPAL